MGRQALIIEADQFEALRDEIRAMRDELRAVRLSPKPEWITAAEYAHQAKVTPRTVRNWINRGEVESKRAGKTVMIRVNPSA